MGGKGCQMTGSSKRDHLTVVSEAGSGQETKGQAVSGEDMSRQLQAYAHDLRETFDAEKQRSEELAKALAQLQGTYQATVRGFAIAVEAKDEYTAGHLYRVTRYGLAILERIVPESRDDPQFEFGFLLHDIGKLGVPDNVLGKAGPLDDDEWAVMKRHPEFGRRIIEDIPFLVEAKRIVSEHHERWDGMGYPAGLKEEEIHIGARIFSVADAFDAMTSNRPYRSAMTIEEAFERLREASGAQFWSEAVDALLSVPIPHIEHARDTQTPSGFRVA